MAYKIIPNACDGYSERQGLEGPFNFNGFVLYYDPTVGQYYDPKTDFYLAHEEFFQIENNA